MVNLDQYDYIIVAFSGGKDSLACILHLLELGIPKEKIELWHHEVDGRETGHFMDWTITPDYCRAIANALGLQIYYSWRVGGYRAELLRENQKTNPIKFETPDGIKISGGKRGDYTTRRMFPMVTNNLNRRWCSAYLKIEAGRAAIYNQDRFHFKKTIMIDGIRKSEGKIKVLPDGTEVLTGRASYNDFEIMEHGDARAGKYKRHVDAWRPVFTWSTKEVWEIIERWKINPHPCYKMGWGRCSCAGCIFSKPDQFASLMIADPDCFWQMFNYESEFDRTIKFKVKQKNKIKTYINQSILDYTFQGTPFHMNVDDIKQVNSEKYYSPIFLKHWKIPAGAFADQSAGPG